MNLSFANPSLFVLGAAIGVPLLIHLVARTRPKVFLFPSVEFLRRALRDTMRARQPREWLVLALRTLLVAALVGAFLQPMLTSESGMAASGENKTILLLVDRSASMGAMENGRTRMAMAVEKANEILDAAGPGTLANVIWLQANPEAVFPDPGPNLGFLREALGKASAMPESGAGEAAWRLAAAQAAAAPGAREIYVLSDFQKAAWENWSVEPPAGVKVFHVAASAGEVPNTAIASLGVVPAQPAAGEPMEVRCTVRNLSPEPLRTNLFLDVGGNRFSRALDLPAWSEMEAIFPAVLPQAGEFTIAASIDEDRFPGDDRRFAVVRARERLRLGIFPAPADKAAHTWRQVAEALGTVAPVPVGDLAKLENAPDYLLVEQWTGENAATLLALAEAGTAVFVQPGPDLSAEVLSELFGSTGGRKAGRGENAPEGGWPLVMSDPESPVFKLFQTGEYGNPLGGRVGKRVHLEPEAFSNNTKVLASYADGVPALARRETKGAPVYLFNLPTSAKDGSWVSQSAFLPFLGELWANSRPIRAGGGAESPAGSPVVYTPESEVEVSALRLVDAEGKLVTLASRTPGGAPGVSSKERVPPGHYRWQADGQTIHTSVVNFPPEESDLRVADAGGLAGTALEAGSAARLIYERDGRPLWPWLMAAGFFFLLGEGLAMHRLPRPRST